VTGALDSALVRRLFEIGAIRFGELTLKFGIVSPFHIDLRVVISHPDVLEHIGALMAQAVTRCGGTASRGFRMPGYTLHAVLTISQCFDEGGVAALADRALVGEARELLRAARFA
jgi:hypothetical protein